MNRFDHAALAAVLTLALMPLTATAEPERAPVSAHVRVSDLDLASAAGQKTFHVRVQRAATTACGTASDLRARFDILRCRAEMRGSAEVRLAMLAAKRPVELAAVRVR